MSIEIKVLHPELKFPSKQCGEAFAWQLTKHMLHWCQRPVDPRAVKTTSNSTTIPFPGPRASILNIRSIIKAHFNWWAVTQGYFPVGTEVELSDKDV